WSAIFPAGRSPMAGGWKNGRGRWLRMEKIHLGRNVFPKKCDGSDRLRCVGEMNWRSCMAAMVTVWALSTPKVAIQLLTLLIGRQAVRTGCGCLVLAPAIS